MARDQGRTPAKIGPSDSSDTIADRPNDVPTDSDSGYTGERVSPGIDPRGDLSGAEYGTDRVVRPADAGLGQGLDGAAAADAEDVGQGDFDPLLARKIHACDACHVSALPLLVLWVALADDAHDTLALDHLAVLTNWFDAAANFHGDSDVRAKLPAWRGEGFLS